jgi:hypothetical protein
VATCYLKFPKRIRRSDPYIATSLLNDEVVGTDNAACKRTRRCCAGRREVVDRGARTGGERRRSPTAVDPALAERGGARAAGSDCEGARDGERPVRAER